VRRTRCIEVFWLLSQPLPHLRFSLFVISETFATFSTQLWTVLRDRHFPPNTGNISLWISFALSPFVHKKKHNRTLLFGNTVLKHGCNFDYWNQPLNMRMRLWPRLSWGWAVLLFSDKHRKHVTFITAVLLPSVTYLLTLPRNSVEVSGAGLTHKSLKLETQFTTDDRRQCFVRRLKLLGTSFTISCIACGR
jgi:hypothetical protein